MDQYRKHILTVIFGVLLVYFGGGWLLQNALQGPLKERESRTASLEKRIEQRQRELAFVRKAKKRLDVWRARSLPSNTEFARSLYQAWLLKTVGDVGLSNPSVDSAEPAARKGRYQSLSFSVRGRGTLEQLTEFLYKFYDAGHLHQLGSLGITPVPNSDELDLSLSIETLALYGADRKDKLTSVRSGRLASESLDDYRVIARRNIFGMGGSPDAVDFTVLTAVTYTEDRPLAWFDLRTRNETLQVARGEILQIDQFEAKVVEITKSDVILEIDNQRWLLTIGDHLADAHALPPEF